MRRCAWRTTRCIRGGRRWRTPHRHRRRGWRGQLRPRARTPPRRSRGRSLDRRTLERRRRPAPGPRPDERRRRRPGGSDGARQGGALIGDLDHETQAFGLVAPSGVVSDTGVAGLTLGGGEGWVRRKHGLSVDNLLSAQLVCADGQVRTASADSNPDLFWAIRGGGGNFGVVTSFTFQCHPVGPMVAFAGVFHPVEDAENVYRQFRDWAATAPDEISALIGCTTLPASEHTPPEIHNTPMIVTGAVYSGDPEEGMKVIQPLRDIGTPLVDISGPLPFVGVQAASTSSSSAARCAATGRPRTSTSSPTRSSRSSWTGPATVRMTGSSWSRSSWAAPSIAWRSRTPPYSERSANWMVSIDGNWHDESDDDKVISWVRGAWGRGARARNGFALPELHGRRR